MTAVAPVPIRFHLGEGWFAAWRAAYVDPPAQAVTIAGLPLLRETAGLGPFRYRRLRSQTNLHTAAFDMAEPFARVPDADMLRGGRAAPDLIELDYVPADSRLLAAARGWTRCRIAPRAAVPVTDCRSPFARWLDSRGKRDRRRLPRLERALADETPLRFAIERGERDLDALLTRLFTLEASGWKGAAGGAIRDNPADTLFYTRLAHAAAAAGALRVALLHDGDAIAAFELAVQGGDRLFVLKAAYDEAHAERSIGHVLAMQHIRACCEDPEIAWYDVLGNGMTPAPHKLRFADHVETLYRIRLFGRGPRAQALRLGFAARDAARRLRDRWRR